MFALIASGMALGIVSQLRNIDGDGASFEYSSDSAKSSTTPLLTLDQIVDATIMTYGCEYGLYGYYNHLPMSLVAMEQLGASPRVLNKFAQQYAMRLKRISNDDFERGTLAANKFIASKGQQNTTLMEANEEWLQTTQHYCTLLAFFDAQLSMAKNAADLNLVKSKTRHYVVKYMLQQSGIVTRIFHPIIEVAYNLIALDETTGKNHISTKAISSALAFSANIAKAQEFYVTPSFSKASASPELSVALLVPAIKAAEQSTVCTSLWQLIEQLHKKRDYFISTMQQNEEKLKRNLIVEIYQEVADLFKEELVTLSSSLQLYKHAGDTQTLNFILDEIHEFTTLFLLTSGVSDLFTLHLVTGSHAVRVVLEKLFQFKPVATGNGNELAEGPNNNFACQVDMIQQLLNVVLVGYIYSKLPFVDRVGLLDKCKNDVANNSDALNWTAVQKLVVRDDQADEHHVKFLYTCKSLAQRQHPELFLSAAKLRCESHKQ